MKSLRIPLMPFRLHENGVITFPTAFLDLNEDGSVKRVAVGTQGCIYLNANAAPKFGKCKDGRGWCSPPADVIDELVNVGEEVDEVIVRCSCQRGELSLNDHKSLERCGHASKCPKADPEPVSGLLAIGNPATVNPGVVVTQAKQAIGEANAVLTAPRDPNVNPDLLAAVNKATEKPKEFTPDNGIPTYGVCANLVSMLEGAKSDEVGVSSALEEMGYTEPFDTGVVTLQLKKFYNLVPCNSCGTWIKPIDKANPKCGQCGS